MPLIDLGRTKEVTLAPGIRARVVSTGNVTVTHVVLDAGAELPPHSHHNEQIVNVVDGELELTVDGDTYTLARGRVMVLPPMVPHSGRTTGGCTVIDVFHPTREDLVRAAQ